VTSIRKRLWEDKDLGELARDVDDAFSALVNLEVKEFDAIYTEPFYVGSDYEPKILFCGRIRNVEQLETPLLTGGLCHFVGEASKQRLRVNSIDGLTTGTGIVYRFTFLLIG